MTSDGGRVGKRGRLAMIAVAVTGALGAGAGVAAAVGTDSAAPAGAGVATAPAAQPVVHAAADAAAPAADGPIAVGDYKLLLSPEGLSVQALGVDKPDLLRVAEVLPGKVSTLASGNASGTLWAGIYRGPVSDTTKVTIKVGGRTLEAHVTSLAGHPGWGVYYVLDSHKVGADKPSITVQSS
ncbi:hypothetical protein [Catenulispora subtropica]|uniref:Secreted protein n=1 Tax=Catenulispora subtropica TaxID=450798 RepID=A0ABP5D448_9ACTN